MTEDKVKNKGSNTCSSDSEGGCNKKSLVVFIGIILIIGGLIFFTSQKKTDLQKGDTVTAEVKKEIEEKTSNFIVDAFEVKKENLKINEISEESGLYKIALEIDNKKMDFYLTKDKSKFIPEAIDMEEFKKNKKVQEKSNKSVAEVTKKTDKPNVELFVMSYCPYGTQIEKGYLPVINTLGESIDSEIKFVSYAMHAEKEVKENLKQYCIQKNDSKKFNKYLGCFLGSSNGSEKESEECIKKNKINKDDLTACITTTDKKYEITKLLKDKSSYRGNFPQFNIHKEENIKYGVQGSPTLVINGQKISVNRDSNSILKAICSAFTKEPEACKKELSSESPAPGFGGGKTSSTTNASCGS